MIRILYWNIEKFALNKIANPEQVRTQLGSSISQARASHDRRDYILDHVGPLPDHRPELYLYPDVFVVVEVCTGYQNGAADRGRLASGDGLRGCDALLHELRCRQPERGWMLVPPLRTGPNEGVAVFYNSNRLVFTGPWLWPGGDRGQAVDPHATRKRTHEGLPPANVYPEDYDGCLPPERKVPEGALQNEGQLERVCAASVSYCYANAPGDYLQGQPMQFAWQRSPYMVTFAEIDSSAPSEVLRNLTLFAVHAPASTWFARNYLRKLAYVSEIVEHQGNSEVRVLAGDFNVNQLDGAGNRDDAYAPLIQQAGYVDAIHVPAQTPTEHLGYYATHIRRTDSAVYWRSAAPENTNHYPGYGYIGSSWIENFNSIDNCFVRYSGSPRSYPEGYGPGNPPPHNTTVLNGVVGSPYTRHPAPPNAPVGHYNLPIAMNPGRFGLPPEPADPFEIGLCSSFRGWANYGRIRSTSDHMALVIDV